MEKQIIFRDRQEMPASDFNDIQSFVELSLQHFVKDAITPERLYVGFAVTNPSATELNVAPGRLWDGTSGDVYHRDLKFELSVISYLPVADQKWLTLSVVGQSVETDIEPRDFMIDLQTGQTEPQQVAMVRDKVAELHVVAGLESSSPQKQNPPTGYTLIGYVRLTPSGVAEIQTSEANQLMSLFATWQETQTNKAWIGATEPQIASLKSDIAAMAAQLALLRPAGALLAEITRDLAHLKDIQGLPDVTATYGSDWFLDDDETDDAEADYYARIDEGVRFPWANMKQVQPALFNPYADEVINHTGLLLPAYTDHVRLSLTTGYAGNIAIGSYQYSTYQLGIGQRTKIRIKYGPSRVVCSNNKNYRWLVGQAVNNIVTAPDGTQYKVTDRWDEHRGFHRFRIRKLWRTTYVEKYEYPVASVQNIAGSQVAQTILAHQSGWLTSLDLYFDEFGDAGDVNLALCETEMGMPVLDRTIATVTLAPENFSTRPTPTSFVFAQPVFLEAGKLYAIVLITQGAHKIALTEGTNYTQGTLFTSTDGVYHQGDFTKDFMLRLHFARFENPRTTVELTSLDLDGGIGDLDLTLGSLEPANTSLIIEYRKEGDSLWYPLTAGSADQLLGRPPLIHLRAVFQGDEFVMPSLDLTNSVFQAARPAVTFCHISSVRVLPSTSENIEVSLRLEGWDDVQHTCVCRLRAAEGSVLTEPISEVSVADPLAEEPTVTKKFVFNPDPGIDSYRIQIDGTATNSLDLYHVAYRHDLAI